MNHILEAPMLPSRALTWSILLLVTSAALQLQGAQRPHIVILYADDLGYGDLQVQNPASKIPTVHLDRLAREGIRLTDAHSSSSICSPSRYALLTGRFHWRKFHYIVDSFGPPALDESEYTLPEMLRSVGYRTACIGKWHLGWDWDAIRDPGAEEPSRKSGYAPDAFAWSKPIPGGPLAHGFDYYFGDDVPNFPPYAWIENDRVVDPPSTTLRITQQTAEGSWEARPGPACEDWDFYAVLPKITRRAVDWIGEQQGRTDPFFLYVPFTSPHAPIVPLPELHGQSNAGGYGDYVVQTDAAVGEILDALAEHGFADNTIVIFTSDNGPERYAYDRIRNFAHRSSGPLRGLKRDLWEGGHRVPLIVRWPGQIPAGSVSDALVSQVDVLATLAAAVGATLPPGSAEDSYNMLPVWREGVSSPRRSIVHNTMPSEYAIRHDRWLLIAADSGAVSPVPEWFDKMNGYTSHPDSGELFDLQNDLPQKNNLHQQMPEKVTELESLLKQIREKGQVR